MKLAEIGKNYIKISLQKLIKNHQNLAFDVFSYNEKDNTYVMLAKAGTAGIKFERNKIDELFIEKKNSRAYSEIIGEDLKVFRQRFENKHSDPNAGLEDKIEALYAYADLLIESAIADPADKQKIDETREFLALTMDMLSVNISLIDKLRPQNETGRQIFRSSINVAVVTMAFLQVMAIRNRDITPKEVLNAAQGALFKDLGMLSMPKSIMDKPGALTEEESSMIKLHPLTGYLNLQNSKANISETGMSVVLYHHEKTNGTGYPYGLKADAIPFFARAVAICDTYYALTSDRSHRDAVTSFAAASILKKDCKEILDQVLLKYFIVLCGPKDLIEQNVTKIV